MGRRSVVNLKDSLLHAMKAGSQTGRYTDPLGGTTAKSRIKNESGEPLTAPRLRAVWSFDHRMHSRWNSSCLLSRKHTSFILLCAGNCNTPKYWSLGGAKNKIPSRQADANLRGCVGGSLGPSGKSMRIVALSGAMWPELWLVPGPLPCKPQPPFSRPSRPWHGSSSD